MRRRMNQISDEGCINRHERGRVVFQAGELLPLKRNASSFGFVMMTGEEEP